MLTLIVPERELFDERNNEFITDPSVTIELEHSLVSLSKWESKWEVPFLSDNQHTSEQTVDYIRCMTSTPNVDPSLYNRLSNDNLQEVSDYINKKMTATWFADTGPQKGRKEVITAELIYYWMVSMTIPWEAQDWHLNRLITLIRVCSAKNQPEKKMSRADLMARNRALNEQRKAQLNTKG